MESYPSILYIKYFRGDCTEECGIFSTLMSFNTTRRSEVCLSHIHTLLVSWKRATKRKTVHLSATHINEDKTKYMQIKRTGTKDITHLKMDNFAYENVENFNYLGSILNADNEMNIKIAERIVKGNKAYYANSKLIK